MQLWSQRYGLFKVPLVFREIANAAIGFKQINFMFKVGFFGSGNDTLETIRVDLFVCPRSRPSHRKMGIVLRPCSSAALYLCLALNYCFRIVFIFEFHSWRLSALSTPSSIGAIESYAQEWDFEKMQMWKGFWKVSYLTTIVFGLMRTYGQLLKKVLLWYILP